MDEKIKSMANKRYEIEIKEKEETIHEKVFGALYEKKNWHKGIQFTFLLCNC